MSSNNGTNSKYADSDYLRIINKKKRQYLRRIALVADTHLMSRYAVMVPDFYTDEGNLLKISDGQKILYRYWKDFCDLVNAWECDSILFASDLIHGTNVKDTGTGLMTTNMNEQQEALKQFLKPILPMNGRESVWVSGSGYHNSLRAMKVERNICKDDGIRGNWQGTVANIKVEPFGKIINLTHGGGGAWLYRETATAREIIFAKVAEAEGKLPHFDIYIHGHWHWYYKGEYANEILIQLPCWIVYEPITIYTPRYTRYQPDIGGCILLFDDDGNIETKKYLYPLIHIADETVEI